MPRAKSPARAVARGKMKGHFDFSGQKMDFCSGSSGRSLQAGLGVRPDHSIFELAFIQRWRWVIHPAFAD